MQLGIGGIPSSIPPPSLPGPPSPPPRHPRQEGKNTMADPPACIAGVFFLVSTQILPNKTTSYAGYKKTDVRTIAEKMQITVY